MKSLEDINFDLYWDVKCLKEIIPEYLNDDGEPYKGLRINGDMVAQMMRIINRLEDELTESIQERDRIELMFESASNVANEFEEKVKELESALNHIYERPNINFKE